MEESAHSHLEETTNASINSIVSVEDVTSTETPYTVGQTMNPSFLSSLDATLLTPHSHKTATIVIMSIFICFTLSITAAIFVFCKKKNSVFTLQKSDKDKDMEYEMDDMNTDIDSRNSQLGSSESVNQYPSPVTVPLMSRLCEYDTDSILFIPYIPDDQSKSDSYHLLTNSTTSTDLKSKDFMQDCHHLHKSNSSSLFRCKSHKAPTCLPFSRSYSVSSIGNNYQSMQMSSEIEPWIHCNASNQTMRETRTLSDDSNASPSCGSDFLDKHVNREDQNDVIYSETSTREIGHSQDDFNITRHSKILSSYGNGDTLETDEEFLITSYPNVLPNKNASIDLNLDDAMRNVFSFRDKPEMEYSSNLRNNPIPATTSKIQCKRQQKYFCTNTQFSPKIGDCWATNGDDKGNDRQQITKPGRSSVKEADSSGKSKQIMSLSDNHKCEPNHGSMV